MEDNNKEFNIDFDNINKLAKNFTFVDILKNFKNYNDELKISQVVKFFERKNIFITKTMIQNYIKLELLPPPINKRYYVKNHLILLIIIDSFKDIYSLEEIGKILKPILNNNNFDDIHIDISTIYEKYALFHENSMKEILKNIKNIKKEISKDVKFSVDENEKEKVLTFLLILNIMTNSITMKEVTKNIINNGYYGEI